MKPTVNDIVLRPRFQVKTTTEKEVVLNSFSKHPKKPFIVKQSGDHVFIRFDEEHTNFWSPQLHLEVLEDSATESSIHGLFGPNPNLWTLFMFLHFGIATVFIIFGIWGYSNWSLQEPYNLHVAVCIFMVILWFGLYAFGRIGKSQGKEQMQLLHRFMNDVLKNINHKQAS
jgi:hypothetical protein